MASIRDDNNYPEYVFVFVSPNLGQAVSTALTTVAKGIAKKTPQNPQTPPKNKIATIMAIACKFTASENNTGTRTTPSNALIIE